MWRDTNIYTVTCMSAASRGSHVVFASTCPAKALNLVRRHRARGFEVEVHEGGGAVSLGELERLAVS